MNLCSGEKGITHDEIVYDGKSCPLCSALSNLAEKEREAERLQEQIEMRDRPKYDAR